MQEWKEEEEGPGDKYVEEHLTRASLEILLTTSSDKQLDTAARARPFQELSQSLALFLSTLSPFRITAIRPRWFFARSLLPLPSFSASHFSQRLRQFLLQAALPTKLS